MKVEWAAAARGMDLIGRCIFARLHPEEAACAVAAAAVSEDADVHFVREAPLPGPGDPGFTHHAHASLTFHASPLLDRYCSDEIAVGIAAAAAVRHDNIMAAASPVSKPLQRSPSGYHRDPSVLARDGGLVFVVNLAGIV